MLKRDYELLRESGSLRPQSSGASAVTMPFSVPSLENGLWCPKEWTIESPEGSGIELLMTGDWSPGDFPSRPIGTVVGCFYQLVIHTETQAKSYLIDAYPGVRLSLPCRFLQLRAMVKVAQDWAQLPDVSGLSYLFQWAASSYNGSRGYGHAQYTDPRREVVGAGASSTIVPIVSGAAAVTVNLGGALPSPDVTLRQYARLDAATPIAADAIVNRAIPLNSYSGYVVVSNQSASDVTITYTWTYYL